LTYLEFLEEREVGGLLAFICQHATKVMRF
jgi:hypothetical protein